MKQVESHIEGTHACSNQIDVPLLS